MSGREVPEVVTWAREFVKQQDCGDWIPLGDATQDALARAAEAQRLRTNMRHVRISPRRWYLRPLKALIVFTSTWHMISVIRAQKLVDAFRAWEA